MGLDHSKSKMRINVCCFVFFFFLFFSVFSRVFLAKILTVKKLTGPIKHIKFEFVSMYYCLSYGHI